MLTKQGSELFVSCGTGLDWQIDVMPRPLRPIAGGLVYHVINRGNNRRAVFHGEGDYLAFLKAFADVKQQRDGIALP